MSRPYELLAVESNRRLGGSQPYSMSMATTTPFLLFDGNCAEAMTFYQSVFGGTLTITRVADMPAGSMPPVPPEKVANARLLSGAIDISATDWMHQVRRPRTGNTVCIMLRDLAFTELDSVFSRLSVGADPDLLDPVTDMPFGTYGHLSDRYGVHWFFVGSKRA